MAICYYESFTSGHVCYYASFVSTSCWYFGHSLKEPSQRKYVGAVTRSDTTAITFDFHVAVDLQCT